MATSLSRRWLLAALVVSLSFPLSVLAQDLVLTTVAPPTTVNAGSSLAIDFHLTKSGGVIENATVDFNASTLPAGVAMDSATGALVSDFTGGVVTIGTFGDGGDTTFTLNLTVASSTADAAVIGVSGTAANETEVDPVPGDNTATADVTVARDISFTLALDCQPDNVLAGSGAGNLACHYDLTQNGPSDASGVAVTFSGLTAGVTIDSGTPTAGTFDPNTGIWTIGDAVLDFDADLDLSLTVGADASDGDFSLVGTVSANEAITGATTASDTTTTETAASVPSGFMTTVAFTNGNAGTVGVTLSCNNGLPLEQSKDISAVSGVNFIVTSLDFIAPDTECEISVDVQSGYTASVLANGVDTGSSCLFSASPGAGEAGFDLSRANTCAITAEPVQSQFVVYKDWVIADDGNTPLTGEIDIWCVPAAEDTGSTFGTVSTTANVNGDGSFALNFYPSPGGATCYAEEDVDSSAVESSSTCENGVPFAIGDTSKTCTITNTVFYEGIPTLSQYGLALLALLMLGIGFVGLRRVA